MQTMGQHEHVSRLTQKDHQDTGENIEKKGERKEFRKRKEMVPL